MTADRYARQQLIEWWDQERLRKARVLVAGAGALGNEVLKNLALVGIGHLLVIDFDRVEASNLSRTTLFRETSVAPAPAFAQMGKKQSKHPQSQPQHPSLGAC